jgi:TfoX/Sxy family transcriptional regulator of competence genes
VSAKRTAAESIPPDRLAAYERMVASQPGLERQGATMPYTSVNGQMFSFLAADGTIALRLDASDRESVIATHGATPHVAHGAVMKEYVSVPEALLEQPDELARWFAASYRYVGSLKPKPTRRPR